MALRQGDYLVYTDGSCSQKVGGWGFVVIREGAIFSGYGGIINCTNNQAEMMAAIMALKLFKGDNTIIVTTDSRYLQDGMNKYLDRWIDNRYRTLSGKVVKNRALWSDLNTLQKDQAPEWEWVKGHSGDVYNEMADHLALHGRLYAEGAKQDGHTSLHNFYDVTRGKSKTKDFYVGGDPLLYKEEFSYQN